MLRLVSAGGAVEEFQWSTSEQIWPFEKADDGSALYCKRIDFGNLPAIGTKHVAHGISGFIESNVFKFDVLWSSPATTAAWSYGAYYQNFQVDATNCRCDNNMNLSSFIATIRMIYKKSV